MKPLHLTLAILALALIAAAAIFGSKLQPGGPVACTMEAKLCSDGSAVGRTGPNCEFAPCPGEAQANIRVDVPRADDEIGLPLIIRGEARVFENIFGYRLLNADGKKLLEGYGEAADAGAGQFSPFELTVNYPDPKTETGTLQVIEFDTVTGREMNTTSIPVRFADVEAAEVSVYFSNKNKDPKTLSCETVYPTTRRVAQTPTIATEAVNELLRGVTGLEADLGFMTSLNPGVELQSLTIENGVARADFNEVLQRSVGGSCRVSAIRAQIEQTLKQFPSVRSVIISINGRSEDILQP